ncbi:MAG: PQQ-binding-like beta-propeller repeat protein, partial [Candidatus Daviesbacteria bacterium]|nr:PQQ-binding-like beta-propeller repeat protein [Candidatus Daviesbacteria bacterium]
MLKSWQYFLVLFFILPLYFLFPKITFADWPGPRYDFNKTGFVPYQISEKPQEKWVSGNISFVWNAPVTDPDGNIYLGTNTGGLTSLDKDGKKRWVTNTHYPGNSVVLDNNNNIYYSVTTGLPKIYSYDQNGNKRWEYSLGNNSPTGVALSRDKNTIYVGIAYPSQTLVALNLDGTLKWQKNLNYNSPASTPLVAPDGTIYVGTGTNYGLFALTDTGTTGIIKWYRYFVGSSDVHSLMLDSSNNIYVKSGGKIVSYDSLGTRRWVYQYSNLIDSLNREEEMALKDNIIYAISNNNLMAINTSGNLIWTFTAPVQISQRFKSPVIDKNGNIYTTYGNIFYILNPDGTLKWEVPLGSYPSYLGKPIIVVNNLFYIYQNVSGNWNGY